MLQGDREEALALELAIAASTSWAKGGGGVPTGKYDCAYVDVGETPSTVEMMRGADW